MKTIPRQGLIISGRASMMIRKNLCPSMEPWMILVLMGNDLKACLFNTTFITRFLRNDWMKPNIRPQKLYLLFVRYSVFKPTIIIISFKSKTCVDIATQKKPGHRNGLPDHHYTSRKMTPKNWQISDDFSVEKRDETLNRIIIDYIKLVPKRT